MAVYADLALLHPVHFDHRSVGLARRDSGYSMLGHLYTKEKHRKYSKLHLCDCAAEYRRMWLVQCARDCMWFN